MSFDDLGSEPITDGRPESLTDAGRESLTDAGRESLTDAGRESLTDAGRESLTNAGREYLPDTRPGSVTHLGYVLGATSAAAAHEPFASSIRGALTRPGRKPHADPMGRDCRRSIRRHVLEREARRGR